MENLLIPILLIVFGLLVGVLFKAFSSRIRLPYTVCLFIFGLVFGFLDKGGAFSGIPMLSQGLNEVANMNANFILYVFLPILIFSAAYEMNLHVFRKTLLNASLLAGPGLVLCMFLTAGLVMLLGGWVPEGMGEWTWPLALMFGGLISATDPVAVVALLQELKTSRRFSTLVDGESLLNDGTGIVCFMLFYSTFAGNAIELPVWLYFTWVCVGSLLIGYLMASLCIWFVTRITSEEVVQHSAMIIGAYLTFIIAQYIFDISGVIAMVVFGYMFARKGRPLCKRETNEFISKFWGLLSHIANTLIFIIVGFIVAVKVEVTMERFIQLLVVYVGITLARYAMIYVLMPLLRHSGYGLSLKESVILGWSGLRGALGLSLALMVHTTQSIPEAVREDVLFFTAGIVFLTLLINATTSKSLLGRLRLIKGESSARSRMDIRIRENIRISGERCLEELKGDDRLSNANWTEVHKVLPQIQSIPQSSQNVSQDVKVTTRIMLLEKELSTVNSLYEKGSISRYTFWRLTDSADALYDYEGEHPLDERRPILSIRRSRLLRILAKVVCWLERHISHTRKPILISSFICNRLDCCMGFIQTQRECETLLERLAKEQLIDTRIDNAAYHQLKDEIGHNLAMASEGIEDIRAYFPRHYAYAITSECARMVLANERDQVIRLRHEGLINPVTEAGLLKAIRERKAPF